MRLTPYKAISTGVNGDGEGVGMIQAVLNSDTTAGIQFAFGGGVSGALSAKPLLDYLSAHNPPGTVQYTHAMHNFIQSCAGYIYISVCVYVCVCVCVCVCVFERGRERISES